MEYQVKQCNTCSNTETELLRCTRCKSVYYCGSDCQKKDWPAHKLKCNKVTDQNKQPNGINQFHQLKQIGSGNFSSIFKAVSKKDGKTYAIKQAQKAKLQRMRKEADLFMEKHCLSKLKDCHYVVRLWKTFQDQLHLFLQMDCPQNGELWDHSKHYGVIGQSVYKYYVSHLCKALSVLHDKYQIVHRDLKPQNILLTDKHELKLIDFGTAKDLQRPDIKGSGNGLKGRKQFENYVGTPNYMAPECIHNKASQKISDVYSLSGVLYFLKVGSPPFCGGSQYIVFKKSIQRELFLCPQLFNQSLSELIHKMNKKEMSERIPLSQVLKHPYFEGVDFENLATYEQAVKDLTPSELYLARICSYLSQNYSNLHKQDVAKRETVYKQSILPYLEKSEEQAPEDIKEEIKKRLPVIKIQTGVMINLREDFNVGFQEIYRQTYHMSDPTDTAQIKTEEVQGVDSLNSDIGNINLAQNEVQV